MQNLINLAFNEVFRYLWFLSFNVRRLDTTQKYMKKIQCTLLALPVCQTATYHADSGLL